MNMDLPKLMIDDSDKDGNAETMMDYVLSWCLRMAQDCYAAEKPKLHDKCKFILCKILGFNEEDVIEFKSVKVWKQ